MPPAAGDSLPLAAALTCVPSPSSWTVSSHSLRGSLPAHSARFVLQLGRHPFPCHGCISPLFRLPRLVAAPLAPLLPRPTVRSCVVHDAAGACSGSALLPHSFASVPSAR